MQRLIRRYSAAPVAAMVAWACGSAEPPVDGWLGTVDTLENGRIVVSSPDTPSWSDPVLLEELFRLGTAEGEGPELFGSIAGLELGPDGQLYVLDGQASEIRVFASDGTHLRTFARAGSGPGELSSPGGLTLDPEGMLWTMNWGNGRYSSFDPATGNVRRETPRPIRFGMFPWPGAMDEQGHVIDVGPDETGAMAVIRMDTAFQPAERIPLPEPNPRDRLEFLLDGRPMVSMSQPFAPQPAWAPRPRGGIMVGDGSSYRIHRVSFAGDTVLTMELDRKPLPVTRAERDSAITAMQERIDHRQNEGMVGLTLTGRPDPRPTKPAHGTLFVDDEDQTWVFGIRAPDQPPAWDVFGADGRYRGSVSVPGQPGSHQPVVRNGRLAVATQEGGFPAVHVYRIVRGSAGSL